MTYRIEVEAAALRSLKRLAPELREPIEAEIDSLAEDPRPPGTRALKGKLRGMLRQRVGDYRIAHEVDDKARVVRVAIIAHRSKVYD